MRFFTLFALVVLTSSLAAQPLSYYINEISYTASNPTAKGFEIAGPAGGQLNGWTGVQYDADGWAYAVNDLSNQVIPNQQNGYGTIWYDVDQAGDNGGLALVDANGVVQQFLAFGALDGASLLSGALDGPAAGLLPQNVGAVGDPYATLQLVGLGSYYGTFQWANSQLPSFGQVNENQMFMGGLPALRQTDDAPTAALDVMPWPNPTTDAFRVNLPESDTGAPRILELFDQQGRPLTRRTLSAARQTVEVNVAELPAGIYVIAVDGGSRSRIVVR